MPKTLIKLHRYRSEVPKACPFCPMNESLEETDYGILGCRFCQKEVDDAISKLGFVIVEQVESQE